MTATKPGLACACGCLDTGHIVTFGPSGPVRGRCRDRDCGCDEYAPGETGVLPALDPDLVDPPCVCRCRRSEHRNARGSGRLTANPGWDVSCSRCVCRTFRTPFVFTPPAKKDTPAPVVETPASRRELVAAARGARTTWTAKGARHA